MSRRSLLRKKTLGYAGHTKPSHEDKGSQCKGDKTKFEGTRPRQRVEGTGQWLGNGSGVGEIVTLPEN